MPVFGLEQRVVSNYNPHCNITFDICNIFGQLNGPLMAIYWMCIFSGEVLKLMDKVTCQKFDSETYQVIRISNQAILIIITFLF